MDDDEQEKKKTLYWMDSTDMVSFFHKEIKDAQIKEGIQLSENVEFYLVQLLCNFVRVSEETTLDACLVHILQKAIESAPSEKISLYKKLGDTTLYFCGFYQEYFTNKSFDLNYYISMGASAYHSLANLMNGKNSYQNTMAQIYKEMSERFIESVDILLHISERTHASQRSRSTLSIYDAWINTDSCKLKKDLLDRGVIPLPQLSRKMQ